MEDATQLSSFKFLFPKLTQSRWVGGGGDTKLTTTMHAKSNNNVTWELGQKGT
jgi:hypothetical protein